MVFIFRAVRYSSEWNLAKLAGTLAKGDTTKKRGIERNDEGWRWGIHMPLCLLYQDWVNISPSLLVVHTPFSVHFWHSSNIPKQTHAAVCIAFSLRGGEISDFVNQLWHSKIKINITSLVIMTWKSCEKFCSSIIHGMYNVKGGEILESVSCEWNIPYHIHQHPQ